MKKLSPPTRLSIRYRLLLTLALTVVLTALAISVVTLLITSRDARDQAIAQLRSVQALKEQEIAQWTSGLALNLDIILSEATVPANLDRLATVATDQAARAEAYGRIADRFHWAAGRMALFEEVFFMDTQGQVLVSTNSGHEGQKLGLNDYFIEGMKNRYLQQPTYSLSLGKMAVVASAPVRYRGRTVGVIAGLANLSGLNLIMLERAGLGDTGETYLVGSNYRLLTDLRRPGYSIPDTYIRTAGTDAAVGLAARGADTYKGYAGEEVIGVYGWIPDLHVALIAEQEEAEALSASRQALWLIIGVAILAAALAILAGIHLTKRILKPLAQLGSTAGRIAGGELELKAEVEREDEIGTLAHAFNRMTGRLRNLVHSLERQTDHLRAINQAGRHISSILELGELLPSVAQSLLETFGYQTVRILLVTEPGTGKLLTCDEGAECGEPAIVDLSEPPDSLESLATVARSGEALLVPYEREVGEAVLRTTADDDGGGETTFRPGGPSDEALPVTPSRSFRDIAVPIRIKKDLVGVLGIIARADRLLDDQDLFAAQTLADQLAVAIDNSRLYEHAHELAASRERQRLARDLHDAVSQTLFSVSLIAEVLPRIYERDQQQGKQRLEELRQLTRGALAEMRTLLLELRPAALAEANLPDLLKQLGEAVTGRARIPVTVEADEACPALPAEVRVALYRIAQEALNNVAKHSGATKAAVSLVPDGAGVRLLIEDDGLGFDPEARTGQLGLGIMLERADAVGALLQVRSAPSQGTAVSATWSP